MKPDLSTMVAAMLIRAEQLESFQMRLNDMADPVERKAAIVAAGSDGFLTRDEATLLVQAYQLENQ